MNHHYPPIGVMKTCFTEKFGVPRQSMMVMEARGVLKLNPDPLYIEALHLLETFSHIWIVFSFHKSLGKNWSSRIEPPGADGPKSVGVFASRSPHRPNPIGMSVVKLEKIDRSASGGIEIHVSGVDLLDGTPVLDIKPYLPYSDTVEGANSGWAANPIARYPVGFSPECLAFLHREEAENPRLKNLIEEILRWDPRPKSQRTAMPIHEPENEGKKFRFRILQFDVEWQIQQKQICVLELFPLAK